MPRVVDHEERRTEIVHALWYVIAEHGIEGVSLRHVAAAAEVSAGRIQHYFGTKEALVVAGCEALIGSAYTGYLETEGASPRDRLLHVVTQQVPHDEAGRFGVSVWYAYVAKAISHPEIRRLLAEARRGAEDECARLVLAARPTGEGEGKAHQQARRLLALADGLTLRVLVGDLDATEAIATLEAEVHSI
ncbi:TetR/AcrR family transcriptional regulator [Antribacter gilvus]|uniref:TetR/AcrR family transcriptional regulator n=1 Tax=Antribacter gilvus TaxID=2304675 RepID=UPI001F0C5560|nr:TetR family transcriptional regulator C-terminal domain-containing protein [Antribacter gilvus]